MNKLLRLALTGLTFFAISAATVSSFAASAATNIEEVNTARLQQIIRSNDGPIIVEFYDSTDPDASGECAREKPLFDAAFAEYAGQVTFLRFDIKQDRALANAGRLVVCPTHLFINHHFPDPTTVPTSVPNRTPFRHWGILTGDQFEELISDFFGIAKPTP